MLVIVWTSRKALPDGLSMTGQPVAVPASDIIILADVTAVDDQGRPVITQTIFDRMLARIDTAREQVLLDNFFFNDISGSDGPPYRKLCSQLSNALILAKARHPEMPVLVITDPINTVYGGTAPAHLLALRRAGIRVVMTDLTRLRDSNPLHSAWWRMGPRWLGEAAPGGRLPNPFSSDGPSVGFRSWLSLLNFKANHRKVLVTDDGQGHWGVIVGSLNAHDGSSRHSNLAVEIRSTALARQVLESESAVAALSGEALQLRPLPATPRGQARGLHCEADLLTEGAIRDAILEEIDRVGPGDQIEGTFFYLSHRGIRRALIKAAGRGATVRLILDPSKDAFGRTKSGIPNRQAALELMTKGHGQITVRWYDTRGEQFHPKAFSMRTTVDSTIIMGSANMTRRNLDDLNLESDIRLRCPLGSTPDASFKQWVDRLWFNTGLQATGEFKDYEDHSLVRRILADTQERTGMGTF